MDNDRAANFAETVWNITGRREDAMPQLKAAIEAAFAEVARETREECAQLMETWKTEGDGDIDIHPLVLKVRQEMRNQRAAAIRALSGGDRPETPEPKTTMTPDLTEFRHKIKVKMATLSLSLRDVEAVAGIDAATLCRFLAGKECSVANFMKLGRWLEQEPPPNPALVALASGELLLCPFCGNWANPESRNGLAFYVVCATKFCAAVGPERCDADAHALWNKRKALRAAGER